MALQLASEVRPTEARREPPRGHPPEVHRIKDTASCSGAVARVRRSCRPSSSKERRQSQSGRRGTRPRASVATARSCTGTANTLCHCSSSGRVRAPPAESRTTQMPAGALGYHQTAANRSSLPAGALRHPPSLVRVAPRDTGRTCAPPSRLPP